MDEFLKQIRMDPQGVEMGFTIGEFLIALTSSAILSIGVSLIYRATHSGLSYSRSFVFSIVIMSVTVSFIMLIIGSNLARAFSLVGALSIVRYRNAVKDTQDISYIFLAIAVGMACGTKLYVMALVFTIFSGVLMILLDRFSFGSEGRINRLMNFRFPRNAGYAKNIDADILRLTSNNATLLSSEITGDIEEVIYEVDVKKSAFLGEISEHFQKSYPGIGVKIITGFDRFNL